MFIHKKSSKVVADEELDIIEGPEVEEVEDVEDVKVAPEVSTLLFETEDVAELLAEVTGQAVSAETSGDGEAVEFAVGEDVYTVSADGDEEILESRKVTKRAVNSSKQVKHRRTLKK